MLNRLFIVTVALLVGVVLSGSTLISAAETAPAPTSTTQSSTSGIAPYTDQLLMKARRGELASADAFSFHAEIMFDQILPPDVKVQFAGAMDFTVQRPGDPAIEYHSDLGGKELWFNSSTLTILDLPHAVYSTLAVPTTIDGMLDSAEASGLTIPLSDFAVSNPCQLVRKQVTYGGYTGVGDVTEWSAITWRFPGRQRIGKYGSTAPENRSRGKWSSTTEACPPRPSISPSSRIGNFRNE